MGGSKPVYRSELATVIISVFLLLGCNRVPGKSKAPALSLSTSIVAAVTSTESAETHQEDVDIDIEPLCTQACEHWVTLRFPTPSNVRFSNAVQRKQVLELFERKRAVNQVQCEEVCVGLQDRDRIQCILQSNTLKHLDHCTAER